MFAARAGAGYSLTFPYGRLAFLATLKALGFRDSEIILPAFTCPTMAGAVVASGNRPVFVDISLADYTMDLKALACALNGRTRAVLVTHMWWVERMTLYCPSWSRTVPWRTVRIRRHGGRRARSSTCRFIRT